MCGQRVHTKADVCVMGRSVTAVNKYLLLVQEDKVSKPHLRMLKIC